MFTPRGGPWPRAFGARPSADSRLLRKSSAPWITEKIYCTLENAVQLTKIFQSSSILLGDPDRNCDLK